MQLGDHLSASPTRDTTGAADRGPAAEPEWAKVSAKLLSGIRLTYSVTPKAGLHALTHWLGQQRFS